VFQKRITLLHAPFVSSVKFLNCCVRLEAGVEGVAETELSVEYSNSIIPSMVEVHCTSVDIDHQVYGRHVKALVADFALP
jgi:hypothetical protein